MEQLRKVAFWAAGVILAIVIPVLIFWPEKAGDWTMFALLAAAALGAIGIGGQER